MKSHMVRIVMVLGVMTVAQWVQADNLPKFMNAQQLAQWRAERAAAAPAAATPEEPTLFFTGKPYDASSGTYLFKYRSYNPLLARWTSADPSGFPDGANNY